MVAVGRRNRHNQPKSGGNRRAKLAARAAEREELSVDPRPFAGFAGECDMVAMREFVPSATARLTTVGDGRDVTVATVLPGAIAGLVRDPELGGEAFVGLQVQVHGPDVAADLAYAVDWARRAGGGETLSSAHPDDTTPALSDVVVPDAPLEVVVHDDFAWWVADGVEVRPEIAQAVRNANEVMMPSARVEAEGIEAAWWVDAGEKAHIRWVRPEDEDALFEALARVHAAGGLDLGEGHGSRLLPHPACWCRCSTWTARCTTRSGPTRSGPSMPVWPRRWPTSPRSVPRSVRRETVSAPARSPFADFPSTPPGRRRPPTRARGT